MSLTAFQKYRRMQQVEQMKPENIENQEQVTKEEIVEPVVNEEITKEEIVEEKVEESQPAPTRRNRSRK